MISGIFCILWKLPISSLVDVWGWKAARVPLPVVALRPSSQSCTVDAGSPTRWEQEARLSSPSLLAAPGPQVWGPLALLVTPGRHSWQKTTEIDTKRQSPITMRWKRQLDPKGPFKHLFLQNGDENCHFLCDGKRGFLGVSAAAAASWGEDWGLSARYKQPASPGTRRPVTAVSLCHGGSPSRLPQSWSSEQGEHRGSFPVASLLCTDPCSAPRHGYHPHVFAIGSSSSVLWVLHFSSAQLSVRCSLFVLKAPDIVRSWSLRFPFYLGPPAQN